MTGTDPLPEFTRSAIALALAHRPRWTLLPPIPRQVCSCGNALPCRRLAVLPPDLSRTHHDG